jgi:hypothetical protein
MDSKLRFTGEIDSIYISNFVDEIIRSDYLEYSQEIIQALQHMPAGPEGYTANYAFVAKGDVDKFFLVNVYYESRVDVIVESLKRISLDSFLEHINSNQYLKYGI